MFLHLKVQCLAFLYIGFDFLRYAVLSVRSGREHNLPFLVVMACVIPVSVMNGVIFMWVFSSLSNLMVPPSERQQTEKLWLFEVERGGACMCCAARKRRSRRRSTTTAPSSWTFRQQAVGAYTWPHKAVAHVWASASCCRDVSS